MNMRWLLTTTVSFVRLPDGRALAVIPSLPYKPGTAVAYALGDEYIRVDLSLIRAARRLYGPDRAALAEELKLRGYTLRIIGKKKLMPILERIADHASMRT